MEPPRPDVRRRATPGEVELTTAEPLPEAAPARPRAATDSRLEELSQAAGAGAAAMAVSSWGEVVLLAALLGVAAGELLPAVVATLAAASVALRWGTTSLEAIAGAQAVLGPGVAVGPLAAAVSTWCAAAALVLAGARGWRAVLFGVTAGLIAAGPGAGSADLVVMRAAAALAGVGVALVAERRAPPVSRPAAVVLAAGAVALAVAA